MYAKKKKKRLNFVIFSINDLFFLPNYKINDYFIYKIQFVCFYY